VGEKRAAAKRPWVTLPSVDSAGRPEFLRDAKGIDAAGSTLQLARYELHSATDRRSLLVDRSARPVNAGGKAHLRKPTSHVDR
jgi:hypothetical protein